MPKSTYLIELCVDEKWFHAISELTAEVYEDEVCEWVRVQAETETTEDDCDNCGDQPKDPNSEYCLACKEDLEGTTE